MNTNTHKVTVGKVVQYLILILMFIRQTVFWLVTR